MSLDRREFLQITTAGVVASLASGACASNEAPDSREVTQPELLAMLGPDRVRALGLRYRQMVPKQNRDTELRVAITDGGRWELRFPWLARPSIAEQVRDDFAAGRTILVDGWVLSATEARQCALFSLQPA